MKPWRTILLRSAVIAGGVIGFTVFFLAVFPIEHPECMQNVGLSHPFTHEPCASLAQRWWMHFFLFILMVVISAFWLIKPRKDSANP